MARGGVKIAETMAPAQRPVLRALVRGGAAGGGKGTRTCSAATTSPAKTEHALFDGCDEAGCGNEAAGCRSVSHKRAVFGLGSEQTLAYTEPNRTVFDTGCDAGGVGLCESADRAI